MTDRKQIKREVRKFNRRSRQMRRRWRMRSFFHLETPEERERKARAEQGLISRINTDFDGGEALISISYVGLNK